MFKQRNSSGKHMICDIKGIKNDKALNNVNDLIIMLQHICSENNFDILQQTHYEFDPIGCSILFLLSESHLSIHTFPEKNHMSFDIYTCRQYKDNAVYNEIFQYLINILDASGNDSTRRIVDRYF